MKICDNCEQEVNHLIALDVDWTLLEYICIPCWEDIMEVND